MPLLVEPIGELPHPEKGGVQILFVNEFHQFEIVSRLATGRIVEAGSGQPQQGALPLDTQRTGRVDALFALAQVMVLCFFLSQSNSNWSCPIC